MLKHDELTNIGYNMTLFLYLIMTSLEINVIAME